MKRDNDLIYNEECEHRIRWSGASCETLAWLWEAKGRKEGMNDLYDSGSNWVETQRPAASCRRPSDGSTDGDLSLVWDKSMNQPLRRV